MTRISTLLLATALAGVAGTAAAQGTPTMICGTRDHVVGQITGRHGERARSIGLAPRNRIVEVFASDETGTWTIIVTTADGRSCLMASGDHFEVLHPEPPGAPL